MNEKITVIVIDAGSPIVEGIARALDQAIVKVAQDFGYSASSLLGVHPEIVTNSGSRQFARDLIVKGS